MAYATTKNPDGFLRQGTVIEIAGHPTKAENGRFVLLAPFLPQGEGRATFRWSRLGADGKVLQGHSTRNLRGTWSYRIEQWRCEGWFRVVSEPAVHPACCGCADWEARYAA